MDEEEIDRLIQELTDAGANDEEIAAILDERIKSQPTTQQPEQNNSGGGFLSDLASGNTGSPVIDSFVKAGSPVIDSFVKGGKALGKTIYSGFTDTLPQTFKSLQQRTASEQAQNAEAGNFDPIEFQKFVREQKGIPFYKPFNGEEHQDMLEPFRQNRLAQRGVAAQLEVDIQKQKAEAQEKLTGTVQRLEDIGSPSDLASYVGHMVGQGVYQIPTSILSGGTSSFLQESAIIYDTQLDLLSEKLGLSREEIIKRGLDEPAIGQAFAGGAGALDAFSAGQLTGILRKSATKSLTKKALEDFLTEASTEAVQGNLERLAASRGADVNFDPLTTTNLSETLNEFVGGGIGGSSISIATQAKQLNAIADEVIKQESTTPEIDAVIDNDTDTAIREIVAQSEDTSSSDVVQSEPNVQETPVFTKPEQTQNVNTETPLNVDNGDIKETKGTQSTEKSQSNVTLGEQLVGKDDSEKVITSFNETPEYIEADNTVKSVADEIRNATPDTDLASIQTRLNEAIQARDNARIAFEQRPEKQKRETVTLSTKQALKDQIKTFYRGLDKGVRKGQKLVNEQLIPRIRETFKKYNLTDRQRDSILSKLIRTNLFTPSSYNKLQTHIDKVVDDANYADKVEQADDLRSKVKKQSKDKNLPQNIRSVSKEFAGLDPDYFGNVDEYITLAETVSNNLTSPKGSKYKGGVDEIKLNNQINQAKIRQENAQTRELLENFSDEFDPDNIVADDTSIEEGLKDKQDKRDEVFNELNAKAKFAKIGLEDYTPQDGSEREVVEELLNADTDTMTADDLATYVRVADNILLNDNFSGSGKLSIKLQAKRNMEEGLRYVRDIKKKGTLGTINVDVYSTGQILDVIFNDQRIVSDIKRLLGIGGILSKGSNRNTIVTDHLKSLGSKIKEINKKYKNKHDVRNKEEQWKLNMLGVLARNTGNDSHIEKIKANLQTDINSRKSANPKYAAKLQEYLNEYKGVKTSDEAIELFKKKDPQIHELWQWYQDNIFTEEFAKQTRRNTNNLYNQSFVVENNYWPYSITNLDTSAKSASEQGSGAILSLNPQQSSNTLEATRSVPIGHAYKDNAISSAMIAYSKTLYDNMASRDVQLLHEMSKRPEFNELIGAEGNENRDKLLYALKHSVAEQYGNVDNDKGIMKLFNDFTAILNDIGRAKALGNLTQIFTQTVPTFTAAAINLGKDFKLVATKVPDSFVKDVIGKTTLSEAGQRHGNTDLGDTSKTYLSEDSDKRIQRVADNLRRDFNNLANWKLSIALTRGDVFARKQSFTAFYIKRLKELGVDPKTIDLSTEGSKQDDIKRIRARSFAEHMVSTLQVPTNRAEQGAILRKKGGVETLRHLFMAFSVFPLNTKVRLARAVKKLGTEEGNKEFAAVIGESMMFTGTKMALAATWGVFLKNLWRMMLGVEEPEKEEEDEENYWAEMSKDKDWQDFARKMSTGLINDLSPVSIGFGTQGTTHLVNGSAYLLRDKERYGDYSYDEWLKETRGLINAPYESEFSDLGVLGVGLGQMKDMGDAAYDATATGLGGAETINLNTFYGDQEVDTEGVEDIIAANALVEWLSVISPNDFSNSFKTVYREQLKDYTPNKKRKRRQSKKD